VKTRWHYTAQKKVGIAYETTECQDQRKIFGKIFSTKLFEYNSFKVIFEIKLFLIQVIWRFA
jgi:hypothetical protein